MKKDKNKKIQKSRKKETSIVRSSAAEYLTFVAATGKGGVEAVYADENIWLTQKMMATLRSETYYRHCEVTGQKRNRLHSYLDYIRIMNEGIELPH